MHLFRLTQNQIQRYVILSVVAVVITSCAIFLYDLGTKPFWDYDEAIYANVIRDTLQSGDILTLKSGAGPYFDKPPLSFWLSIGFDTIFHHAEFSYRLTAALASITSVALVMLITYEITGDLLAAALAGIILATTGPFIQAGRELRLDVPAVAMILFAIYSFLRGLRNPLWFLGIGIGLAVGFMFKSVIGLLSIPFLLLWSAYNRDISWIKSRYMWLGALLFFLLLAPWHIYESVKYGSAFWAGLLLILGHANADTLGGSYSSTQYFAFFLTYAAPWTTLFAVMLVWLGFNFKKSASKEMRYLFVFASSAVFLFLLFLVSKTKILTYLLPVYPFVAMSIALAMSHSLRVYHHSARVYRSIWTIFALLLAFAFWVGISYGFHVFAYVADNDLIVKEEKDAAFVISQRPDLPLYAFQYDYYDTIEYYSGRRTIQKMNDNQELSKPFWLIVPKPYMDWHKFPPELNAHLQVFYKGQTLILYQFTP